MFGLLILFMPFMGLAGLMAFLITYREMCHHFSRREAFVHALRTALAAVLLFVGLSFLIVVLTPEIIR